MKLADSQIIRLLKQILAATSGGAGAAWGAITGTLSNQTDLQSALDAKQASLGFTAVPDTRTVNGHALSGNVTVSKADVGLTNADDTSDANKPVSTAQATAIAAKVSDTAYDATSWDAVTTIAPSKNAVRDKIEAVVASIPAAPYLVYTALINQSGVSAPTATVLRNTLGGTPVWEYEAEGQYALTITGAFLASKTESFAKILPDSSGLPPSSFGAAVLMSGKRQTSNTFRVAVMSGGTQADDLLPADTFFEVRVFP